MAASSSLPARRSAACCSPRCFSASGFRSRARLGAIAIVGGLVVIGAESIGHIGPDGVLGDLLFVVTGFMFAVFGTLLRHWRVAAFSAATVISVLSLSLLPLYAAFGGFTRVATLGVSENALQALAQGIPAGPAPLCLFPFSVP